MRRTKQVNNSFTSRLFIQKSVPSSLSVCLSLSPFCSVHLSLTHYLSLAHYLFVCLSLSLTLSLSLNICLSVCLSWSVWLSFSPSPSVSISLSLPLSLPPPPLSMSQSLLRCPASQRTKPHTPRLRVLVKTFVKSYFPLIKYSFVLHMHAWIRCHTLSLFRVAPHWCSSAVRKLPYWNTLPDWLQCHVQSQHYAHDIFRTWQWENYEYKVIRKGTHTHTLFPEWDRLSGIRNSDMILSDSSRVGNFTFEERRGYVWNMFISVLYLKRQLGFIYCNKY